MLAEDRLTQELFKLLNDTKFGIRVLHDSFGQTLYAGNVVDTLKEHLRERRQGHFLSGFLDFLTHEDIAHPIAPYYDPSVSSLSLGIPYADLGPGLTHQIGGLGADLITQTIRHPSEQQRLEMLYLSLEQHASPYKASGQVAHRFNPITHIAHDMVANALSSALTWGGRIVGCVIEDDNFSVTATPGKSGKVRFGVRTRDNDNLVLTPHDGGEIISYIKPWITDRGILREAKRELGRIRVHGVEGLVDRMANVPFADIITDANPGMTRHH